MPKVCCFLIHLTAYYLTGQRLLYISYIIRRKRKTSSFKQRLIYRESNRKKDRASHQSRTVVIIIVVVVIIVLVVAGHAEHARRDARDAEERTATAEKSRHKGESGHRSVNPRPGDPLFPSRRKSQRLAGIFYLFQK